MIFFDIDPEEINLQIATQDIDGTPKLNISSAYVRVYHMTEDSEYENLSSIEMDNINSSSIWRYIWEPEYLNAGQYIIEYTLTDEDGLEFIGLEDLIIISLETDTTGNAKILPGD